MDVSKRRTATRSSVAAGSVWESRMKSDEVRGGIKVFNGEESKEESGAANGLGIRRVQNGGGAISGKRKTWKSEGSEGFDKNAILMAKGKTEPEKNHDEQGKEVTSSAEGIKKSPIHGRKREIGAGGDKPERSPVQVRKPRSEWVKGPDEVVKSIRESAEGIERNSVRSKISKSELDKEDSAKSVDESDDGVRNHAEQSKKMKQESSKVLIATEKSVHDIEKNPVGVADNESDGPCREFDVCEDKVISSSTSNVGAVKSVPLLAYDDIDADEEEDEWDEAAKEDDETEAETSFDIKKINIAEQKKVANVVQTFHHINEKPVPSSFTVKQPSPITKQASVYPNVPKPPPNFDEFHSFPENHSKLQSLVDLIMWRDVSRSAFVFGIGTFIIISCSYTKDINVSFISVISYLGLLYLAAIFLYRSIICRGAVDTNGNSYVVGEDEAIWLVNLFLPYFNEFLLKLKALFWGDPATTMKLAALLFVLARCGSSITIWKVAKWGFFGVFTVPKIYSLYSTQLTAYAKFWIQRFGDAWNSCSHKKGVAVAIFMLVWNLSSVVARIWAAFMLFVAFRYYQQSQVRDGWQESEAGGEEDTCQAPLGAQRRSCRPASVEGSKQRKKW